MKLLLVLLLGLAACGPKTKNRCAGNAAGNCVFGEKCTFDQAQGCQVCVCETPSNDSNPRDPADPTNPNPPFPNN